MKGLAILLEPRRLLLLGLTTGLCLPAFAARDLNSMANLHPLDTFTADVLDKGEWYYGQPPIPAPGYNFVGLSDKLTLQIDYTAWLGGLPSLNLRQRLFGQRGQGLSAALEGMLLYMRADLDEMDTDNDTLYIRRRGWNGYLRLNTSLRLSDKARLHTSLGISYSEYLHIQNENRPTVIGKEHV